MTARAPDDARSLRRTDFPVLREVSLRWADVDVYGHVNNVVHFALFDTAVNSWLIEATTTDIRTLPAIGVVAETGCRYLAELDFPATVTVGLRCDRLGTSSVTYRLALFATDRDEPAAVGRFVHVYVDRDARRPVTVPSAIAQALLGAMQSRPTDPVDPA